MSELFGRSDVQSKIARITQTLGSQLETGVVITVEAQGLSLQLIQPAQGTDPNYATAYITTRVNLARPTITARKASAFHAISVS